MCWRDGISFVVHRHDGLRPEEPSGYVFEIRHE